MDRIDAVDAIWSELEDYYMAQSRSLVTLYLVDHGITPEMLQAMPVEQVQLLLKQALDFAAEQIARMDMMTHLGQRDSDSKMETQPHQQHGDRLSHYFKTTNKS